MVFATSLQGLNKRVHPIGAFPIHPKRRMGVSCKGKRRSCVTEILLHRLDIVPCLETVDREGVPEIVESELRQAQSLHDAFEVDPQGFVVDIPSCLVGKDKVLVIVPG